MTETDELVCFAIDSDGNPITIPMKRDGDVWRGTAPMRCRIVGRDVWLEATVHVVPAPTEVLLTGISCAVCGGRGIQPTDPCFEPRCPEASTRSKLPVLP